MNLPFGTPNRKEYSVRRREEAAENSVMNERRLAEYRDIIESYKKCIIEYASRLESYDKKAANYQLSNVQTALDLTYIKEQGDKTFEILEAMRAGSMNKAIVNLDAMNTTLSDVNFKLDTLDKMVDLLQKSVSAMDTNIEMVDKSVSEMDKNIEGLDKNVVNRLSELLLEVQKQIIFQNKQLQSDLTTGMDKIHRSVKRGHILLWFVFLFNLFGLGAIVIFVLYYLQLLPI